MKVVHAIASPFARDGIGYIAYQRTLELYRRGFLKKVMASSFFPNEIGEKCRVAVNKSQFIERSMPRFFSLAAVYLVKDIIFDLNVSLKLPEADIFHGWSGQALRSIKKAKKKGQVAFLERPNSYPLTLKRLMDKEYDKYGVKLCHTNPKHLNMQLGELDLADYVIVPSQFAYNSFLEHGFSSGKLLLIPFGVDTDRFRPRERKNGGSKFRVVYVGQIGLRKGVQYLLEAWSDLKLGNAELVLAGWTHRDIAKILQKYRDLTDVEIRDFTLDTAPLYEAATVCVFPSIEDGFGLVVLEAMACGKPVITTENTGAKDVIDNEKDGFIVPPGDVEALKEKILLLYKKKNELSEVGKAARQKALLHTWNIYADMLIAVYKKSLTERRPA